MIENLQVGVKELEGEEGIQAEGEVGAIAKIDDEPPDTEKVAKQKYRPEVIDYPFG